jgi:hypothetical protein
MGVRACLKMWMQAAGSNRYVPIVINRSKTDRDIDVMGRRRSRSTAHPLASTAINTVPSPPM